MNIISRILAGLGFIILGIILIIIGLLGLDTSGFFVFVIYGLILFILGFFIFFNKKEDKIEQIKINKRRYK